MYIYTYCLMYEIRLLLQPNRQGLFQQGNRERKCISLSIKINIMARPIAETPIVRGKDAIIFRERMKNVKKISDEERKKINEAFEYFKSIADFEV
ncbi:hypothetical protein Barb4_01434 [Bacteroidales bacterium Barb4]|nr:hypothetical protein Barb4_01434 [Bacteroidales bacterium Barb4]